MTADTPSSRSHSAGTATVRAWEESVSIPTYGVGRPNRNPMFLEKRVYQGSRGTVYPFPVIDRIEDEKRDRTWRAVFLENEFLRIMILPELGGRIQMALDKTNNYHFVYYNRVIKPALVGLAGPWISGGIEFNWPQHHRPSTFLPLAWDIQCDSASGAATVWLHEIDRMYRTECTHGFTVRPNSAVLEVEARIYNRTELPQTFLWWANPAVHVDENHQSVFPPDVSAVMDHGRRDVSAFPIAVGEYYKVDYAPGTDISRYRNIPVPTSYMAHRSEYDFVGSYDHGRRAGLLHVCNHHLSPGKKQWTWGTADFGKAWERQLTDEDGPYVELMCGVFTDNQPDFSWLMPGEEKTFTQYFMPYQGVGVVKNATADAAVGLEVAEQHATVRAYTTAPQIGARAVLKLHGETVWEERFDGGPGGFFETAVPLPAARGSRDAPRGGESTGQSRNVGLEIQILSPDDRLLVDWTVPDERGTEIPQPAEAIAASDQLESVESLYLAGVHLEQYRHATREPEDYYREGLSRDPGDVRCNTALGRLLYRRGRFAAAEPCLHRAVQRITRHNPNPYDGEPFFLLGCVLERLDRCDEAYAAYHKAVWNAAWQDAGYFALARLDCRAGRYRRALQAVDNGLARNAAHRQARHLKVALLRILERGSEAAALARRWLNDDVFQPGLLYELMLPDSDETTETRQSFLKRMRDDQVNYVELALDYAAAGLYAQAVDVLRQYLSRVDQTPDTPIVFYLLADCCERDGEPEQAAEFRQAAVNCSADYCFPNRLEEIDVLQRAAAANPEDAKALYYLGNLWYDRRQHDLAISCWRQSRDRDPTFATVWRNLGLASFNKLRDADAAWSEFSEAFRLDQTDSRVLFELDQLAKHLGHPPVERLERLSRYQPSVTERDDLTLEYVTLLNVLGRHQQALDILTTRRFHPWEGGEGRVAAQYTVSLMQLARNALAARDYAAALDHLERAGRWPDSLGEGKLPAHQENNLRYWQGVCLRGLRREADARAAFREASEGLSEPSDPLYYNDQPPDMIYYQGLALRALGQTDAAAARFQSLVDFGKSHLAEVPEIDFFAVSLPDFLIFEQDLQRRNELHCRYLIALGMQGLGDIAGSTRQFDLVLSLDPSHLGATIHRKDDAAATPADGSDRPGGT